MGTYIRKKMTHLSANILIVDDEQSVTANLKCPAVDGVKCPKIDERAGQVTPS